MKSMLKALVPSPSRESWFCLYSPTIRRQPPMPKTSKTEKVVEDQGINYVETAQKALRSAVTLT